MSAALERVSYVYEPGTPWEVTAVRGVSLRVDDGEAVGVIGPTGSGKSTLVQLLGGLIRPHGGRVLIDGRDLWAGRRDRRRLRLSVGLVFQYPEQQLFEETVRADLAFGPRNLGLHRDEVRRRVRAALDRVGLPAAVLDRSPFALSGGQKRRVAIAGVLAMEPRMLVLDEPTAGLDPRGRQEILDFVRALHGRDGLTVVAVSHNMEELARLAGRVVVMDDGAVAMDGPARRIYARVGALRGLGLDVPVSTRVVGALAARGWPVREDCLSIAEAAETIARAVPVGAPDAGSGGTPGA